MQTGRDGLVDNPVLNSGQRGNAAVAMARAGLPRSFMLPIDRRLNVGDEHVDRRACDGRAHVTLKWTVAVTLVTPIMRDLRLGS
jgi:hypothetical protein